MATLVVEGVPLDYDVQGRGPVVVVPAANVARAEMDLGPLLRTHTVITVSPAGFLASGRRTTYDGADVGRDVRGVLDHLGVDRYATLGYSLNGAMASFLAVQDPRVVAVVCGGFPTTGSYDGLRARFEGLLARRLEDPVAWSELVTTHDPQAVTAFYEALGRLAPGALVEGSACPSWSWWGEADDTLAAMVDLGEHARSLERQGITHRSLPGLDHAGALARLDLVLPEVAAWLGRVWPTQV